MPTVVRRRRRAIEIAIESSSYRDRAQLTNAALCPACRYESTVPGAKKIDWWRPTAGAVLLASVSDDNRLGSVWYAFPVTGALADHCPDERPISYGAQELPARLARAEAPILLRVGGEPLPEWTAALIGLERPVAPPRVLEGDSYGLALTLAGCSWLAELPLGETLPLAAVNAQGAVREVSPFGLERKLKAAWHWLPSLKQVIVDERQKAQVKEILKSLGWELKVVGVRSVAEAVEVVFPELERQLADRGAEPAEVQRKISQLYRLVRPQRRVLLGWKGVERAARLLNGQLDGLSTRGGELSSQQTGNPALLQAQLVEGIALRHQGRDEDGIELMKPQDEALTQFSRPRRLEYWAEFLMSTVSSNRPDLLVEWLVRAERQLEGTATERHAEDALLLDAVARGYASLAVRQRLINGGGNALAANGAPSPDFAERALERMEESMQTFQLLEQLADAWSCVGEYLRIAGMFHLPKAASAARGWAELVLSESELPGLGRAAITVALGRCCVQLGDQHNAQGYLNEELVLWQEASAATLQARRRWSVWSQLQESRCASNQTQSSELSDDSQDIDQILLALYSTTEPKSASDLVERLSNLHADAKRLKSAWGARRSEESEDPLTLPDAIREFWRY